MAAIRNIEMVYQKENNRVMITRMIAIVAASVAAVLLMFVLGKLADGKGGSKESAEK